MEKITQIVSWVSEIYDPTITVWHAINCGIIAVLIAFSSLHHQEDQLYRYSGILGYILAASSAWISLEILFGTYDRYTESADFFQVLVITGIVILVRGDIDRVFYVCRKLWGYSKKLRGKQS